MIFILGILALNDTMVCVTVYITVCLIVHAMGVDIYVLNL